MAEPPQTMRAVVMERRGPAGEALAYYSHWPAPVPKPGQILVQAAATSVSAGDWKMRSGFAPIPLRLPKILGEDLAGVVVQAPEGSRFKKGDRVFAGTGQTLKSGERGGCYAELVAADEATACLVPPGVSLRDAAVVPVSGLTAWQALEPGMPLAGKRVLVHAGAGGVGNFAVQASKGRAHEGIDLPCQRAEEGWRACSCRRLEAGVPAAAAAWAGRFQGRRQQRRVPRCARRAAHRPARLRRSGQIAKAQGAHVTTTCSSRNVEFVTKTLRADVAIDYTKGPWEAAAAAGPRYDLILDTIGGPYEAASLALLAPGGRLAALGATGPGVERVSVWGMAALLLNAVRRYLAGRLGLGPAYTFVMPESKASRGLEQIAQLMAQGKVKAHIDRTFPLEQMAKAHEYAEQGHVRGKVGVAINDRLR
eukprot:scaffold14.g1194.t1